MCRTAWTGKGYVMRIKTLIILFFYSAIASAEAPKIGVDFDYLIIAVCDSPAVVILNDKRKKVLYITPILVFLNDATFHKFASVLIKVSRTNLAVLDAAKFTTNKHECPTRV